MEMGVLLTCSSPYECLLIWLALHANWGLSVLESGRNQPPISTGAWNAPAGSVGLVCTCFTRASAIHFGSFNQGPVKRKSTQTGNICGLLGRTIWSLLQAYPLLCCLISSQASPRKHLGQQLHSAAREVPLPTGAEDAWDMSQGSLEAPCGGPGRLSLKYELASQVLYGSGEPPEVL